MKFKKLFKGKKSKEDDEAEEPKEEPKEKPPPKKEEPVKKKEPAKKKAPAEKPKAAPAAKPKPPKKKTASPKADKAEDMAVPHTEMDEDHGKECDDNLEGLGNANTYEEKEEIDAFADNIPLIKAKDQDTHTEFPRFVFHEYKCGGTFEFRTKGTEKHKKGKSINKAIKTFKDNPKKWIAMTFQANSRNWPVKEQEYYMIERKNSIQLFPKGVSDDGWMSVYLIEYQHLPRFKDDVFPMEFRDQWTDDMTHKGKRLHDSLKPICPGRGQGCADTPLVKIIGDIDPSDIKQGQVGCCWMLSAISALAEFDGAIKKLFRKTRDLHLCPKATPNQYTITLWDLTTWTEVDYTIDERLAVNPYSDYTTSTLLSSKASDDGELWVCYLEKAISIHCGGWDAVTGGQCTHAWAIMTGCREQYIIMRNAKTKKWQCKARYNPHERMWLRHENNIHECDNVTGVWDVPFPVVGDNDDRGDDRFEMTDNELFLKMYASDQVNYIVSAGSKGGGSDTDSGLVDNHAYTVIEAVHDAAGTGIDMFKVRNPWGKGEIDDGEFDDDGPGWDKYPQIKALLNPVVADDGIFWVTKQEFFEFFANVYISASNMTAFLED